MLLMGNSFTPPPLHIFASPPLYPTVIIIVLFHYCVEFTGFGSSSIKYRCPSVFGLHPQNDQSSIVEVSAHKHQSVVPYIFTPPRRAYLQHYIGLSGLCFLLLIFFKRDLCSASCCTSLGEEHNEHF